MPRDVEPEFRGAVSPLCQAILACCPEEQLLQRFLRDLLTPAEAERLAKRWQAARLLLAKKTCIETARELGLSSKTVTAVARFANGFYATGGFAEVDSRLREGGFGQQRELAHGEAQIDEAAFRSADNRLRS